MPYSFFVLTKSDDFDQKIFKIPMREDARKAWAKIFADQRESYNSLKNIPFSVGYKVEPDEVFFIEDYVDEVDLLETSLDPEKFEDFDHQSHLSLGIKAIFASSSEDTHTVFFQCFDNRQIIMPGKGIILTPKDYDTLDSHVVSIANNLDAILDSKGLRFKNFYQARKIFDLTEYFKEATDDQVDEFLDHPLFQVQKDGFKKGINQNMRKKIALILKSEVLNRLKASNIETIAAGIGLNLEFVDSRLVIPAQKSKIVTILQFLDSGIWRCPLTQKVFETNSKREK